MLKDASIEACWQRQQASSTGCYSSECLHHALLDCQDMALMPRPVMGHCYYYFLCTLPITSNVGGGGRLMSKSMLPRCRSGVHPSDRMSEQQTSGLASRNITQNQQALARQRQCPCTSMSTDETIPDTSQVFTFCPCCCTVHHFAPGAVLAATALLCSWAACSAACWSPSALSAQLSTSKGPSYLPWGWLKPVRSMHSPV